MRIGGVDVKDIPSAELMDMVSFVFQDSRLAENVDPMIMSAWAERMRPEKRSWKH